MTLAPELVRALDRIAADETLPLADAIQHAVDSAAALFAVAGCGVMFIDDAHALHYIGASDGHGRELEHVQQRTGTGPCVEALVEDRVVQTADVTTDERWPQIHADLAETRVRAVLGAPVHLGGVVVGSIDVYRDSVQDWENNVVEGLLAYAGLVERLLLSALRAERHERTVEQLQHALDSRVVIERAVGVLMERERIDAVEAFQRLRATARSSRRRVSEIAADLLAVR